MMLMKLEIGIITDVRVIRQLGLLCGVVRVRVVRDVSDWPERGARTYHKEADDSSPQAELNDGVVAGE